MVDYALTGGKDVTPPEEETLGQITEGLGYNLRPVGESELITAGVVATDDAGGGDVATDVNATDFTSQSPDSTTYYPVTQGTILTVVHKGVSYNYTGPKGVTIGVGGSYATAIGDYAPLGTADHSLLSNRDTNDAHPTSAITGLDTKQASQDSDILANTALINGHLNATADAHAQSEITGLVADQANQDAGIATNAQNFADHINEEVVSNPHPQYEPEAESYLLYGDANNFTLNTTTSTIQGYTEGGAWGGDAVPGDIDQASGVITINKQGVWQVVMMVVGDQGNSTKEESIELRIRAQGPSGTQESTMSVFDVATDKTSKRAFSAVFSRAVLQSALPMDLDMRMWASAGLGTFSIDEVSFELHLLRAF